MKPGDLLFTLHTIFLVLFVKVRSSPPRCDSIEYTTPLGGKYDYTTPAEPVSPGAVTMPQFLENSGWWCATENAAGQNIASLTSSDSCFCIGFSESQNISVLGAECSAAGGYLADIKSDQENALIGDLIKQAYQQDPTGPEYSLYIGLSKKGLEYAWTDGCTNEPPTYTNYNQTGQQQLSLNTIYMYSSDGTWTANNDPINGTANGYVCKKKRNPCAPLNCNATQTCIIYNGNCAYCQDPTTTAAETTTQPLAPGASNPVPFCDPAASAGGWWCARDYPLGQAVTTANASDSCFCYMYQNLTQPQAKAACEAIGGYLTDIRNQAENDLLQQLVNLVLKNAAQVQLTACPTNWTLWQGACYQPFKKPMKWHPAEQFCWNNYSAHLASVHSKAEYQFLNSLSLSKLGSGGMGMWGYWTGQTDEITNNVWIWSDGTPSDYVVDQSLCKVFVWMMEMIGLPLDYLAVRPEIPCGHSHYDDATVVPMCKKIPVLLPMWIGLVKNTTMAWDRGCEVIKMPTGFNSSVTGKMSQAAYIYNANKTWTQQNPNSNPTVGAMCRKDRDPCGASNCTKNQTCVNTGNCYYCVNLTTTTTTTSTSTTTTTMTTTTTSTTTPTTTTTTTTTTPTTTTTTPMTTTAASTTTPTTTTTTPMTTTTASTTTPTTTNTTSMTTTTASTTTPTTTTTTPITTTTASTTTPTTITTSTTTPTTVTTSTSQPTTTSSTMTPSITTTASTTTTPMTATASAISTITPSTTSTTMPTVTTSNLTVTTTGSLTSTTSTIPATATLSTIFAGTKYSNKNEGCTNLKNNFCRLLA